MRASILSQLRRAFSQPAFVTVAIVLLIAALSLNATAQFMKLHFQKQRVELRKKLTALPAQLGPWVQVTTDAAIDPETEQVLQTKEYIFRFYVDRRSPHVTAEWIESLKNKDSGHQRAAVERLQARDPHAVIYAAVTYYTGMVDTVAHIPDRCYVADGYEPSHSELKSWDALKGRRGDGYLRFINFEDQTPSRRAVTKNVAYLFHSNGEYVCDPLGVRKKLQNLLETHAYYAKVELMMVTVPRSGAEDAARVEAQLNDFLKYALPEVEKCLPDWSQVKQRGT